MRLILRPRAPGASFLIESPHHPARIWRSPEGRQIAYGYRDGATWVINVPGVAVYRLGMCGTVTAAGYSCVEPGVIRDIYRRAILPLTLQFRGTEVLHASAVCVPRGVVGLCGISGTGKSTIAHALGLRGYTVWADDCLVFRTAPGRIASLPVPFALRLRPESVRHFGDASAGTANGTAHFLSGQRRTRPLAALCVLHRARGPGPPVARLVPLEPARAFSALLPHAYCLDLEDIHRKVRMIQHYFTLAARVPVYEVRFSGGLAGLGAVLEAVESVAAGRVHA